MKVFVADIEDWKQINGSVKERWGKLTDDDLTVIRGRRDQLESKLQERYGYAKDRARRKIEDWYRSRLISSQALDAAHGRRPDCSPVKSRWDVRCLNQWKKPSFSSKAAITIKAAIAIIRDGFLFRPPCHSSSRPRGTRLAPVMDRGGCPLRPIFPVVQPSANCEALC